MWTEWQTLWFLVLVACLMYFLLTRVGPKDFGRESLRNFPFVSRNVTHKKHGFQNLFVNSSIKHLPKIIVIHNFLVAIGTQEIS